MLKTVNLSKEYNNGVVAVNNVSVTLPDKGMIFILGKSGSGKSTLLNLLAGIDTKTSGLITYNNADVNAKSLDDYRRNHVGFVYQDYQLINDLSVYENVALAKEVLGEKVEKTEIAELLKKVGCEDLIDRKANELSGGQIQRVSIARAILKTGATVFADEPTGNLDEENGKGVFELLKEISKERLVVVVTHDRESAENYGDGIIEISDGKIISDNVTPDFEVEEDEYKEIAKIKKNLPFKSLVKLAKWSTGKRVVKQIMYIAAMTLLVAINVICYGFFSTSESRMMMSSFRQNSPNSIMVLNNKSADGQKVPEFGFKNRDLAQLGAKAHTELFPFDRALSGTVDVSSRYLYTDSNGMPKVSNSDFWRLTHAIFVDKPEELDIDFIEGKAAKAWNEVAVPRIYADNIISNGYMQTASPVVFGKFNAEEVNKIIGINSYADIIGQPFYAYDCKFVISGIFEDNSLCDGNFRCMSEVQRRENDVYVDGVLNDIARDFVLDKCAIFSQTTAFNDYVGQSPSYMRSYGKITPMYVAEGTATAQVSGYYYLWSSELNWLSDDLKARQLSKGEIIVSNLLLQSIAEGLGSAKLGIGDKLKLGYHRDEYTRPVEEYTIVGIIDDWERDADSLTAKAALPYGLFSNGIIGSIVFSDEDYSYVSGSGAIFTNTYSPHSTGFVYNARKAPDKTFDILKNEIQTMLKSSTYYAQYVRESDELYSMQSDIASIQSDISSNFSGTIYQTLQVKMYAAPALFAVSTVLLLLFLALFCGVSFETKEKDVGILKALGARKRDIYLLFIIQVTFIALIYFAIGSIIGGLGLLGVNAFFSQELGGLLTVAPYTADNFFVVLSLVLVCIVGAIALQIRRLLKKSAMQIMRQ